MKNLYIFKFSFVLILSFIYMGGCNEDDNNRIDLPEETNSAEDFELDIAVDLAELSLVAYEQRLQCINGGKDSITVPAAFKLEEVIFSEVSVLDTPCKDDSEVVPIAFIATKGDAIYLSFRGTANVTDISEDILITQDSYKYVANGGKTASGFTETYEGSDKHPVREPILDTVNQLVDTDEYNSLYITGHSLGAALSVLAFPDLSENTSIKSVVLYNFASPAVGNDEFVKLYDSLVSEGRHTSWRIVNTNDVIPFLPPQGIDCQLFMYEHVLDHAAITFGVIPPPLPILSCDLLQLLEALSDYITGTSNGTPNIDIIEKNHSMCTYFMKLCAMAFSDKECESRAIGCN
ncbi:MAG: lipase family protein [Candidatus Dadabacteria bacterium]|nr:lipase family protein [Candidatus Dadabacteria bacterium]